MSEIYDNIQVTYDHITFGTSYFLATKLLKSMDFVCIAYPRIFGGKQKTEDTKQGALENTTNSIIRKTIRKT